jgi:deoxyribose-phosphate aldolase
MTRVDYQQLIACIDLTSLNTDDTVEKINALCAKAKTPLGNVAAVCVYPQFVSLAWQNLMHTPIKVATVANFPQGTDDIHKVSETIQQAILDGAVEIDVVVPYHAYAQHDTTAVSTFVSHCKMLCGTNAILKTILECSALDEKIVMQASNDAISAGADFLKTSTGKIPIGATIEKATIMLQAIKHANRPIGFKASGGIRTIEQAKSYAALYQQILGEQTITSERFRLGASTLLDTILEQAHAENR